MGGMGARGIWQFIWTTGRREAVSEVLRILWPLIAAGGVSVLTMLSAAVTPVPLPYLIAAAALAFGAVLWGAVQVSILTERNRVQDRLFFADVHFSREIEERDGQFYLVAAQIGFIMVNSASFPMHFRVENIHSTFAGRINENPTYDSRSGMAIKDRPSQYRDSPIEFPDGILLEPGRRYIGTLSFRVIYGADTEFGHEFSHKVKIEFSSNKNDPTQLGWTWRYIE